MNKIEEKLEKLYDRLDELGDLRDRGYSVPVSDIREVKDQIDLLRSVK